MSAIIGHLSTWLKSHEDEHLEFKEAKTRFDFERLFGTSLLSTMWVPKPEHGWRNWETN